MSRRPVLVVGAGALGGALIAGWLRAGALSPTDLMILDPFPGAEAAAAVAAGARLDPDDGEVARAATVILAVKPQEWRAAATLLAPRLSAEAAIVSAAAGVGAEALGKVFEGRRVARIMPTLSAAVCRGSIVLWSAEASLAAEVEALMTPLGVVTPVPHEEDLHAATAASGSGPAYLYAFIEALEVAAIEAGLPAAEAARMVRASLCGAAALLSASDDDPAVLRRRVTSPGGTTAAALETLLAEDGLRPLLVRAVKAAAARSQELGK